MPVKKFLNNFKKKGFLMIDLLDNIMVKFLEGIGDNMGADKNCQKWTHLPCDFSNCVDCHSKLACRKTSLVLLINLNMLVCEKADVERLSEALLKIFECKTEEEFDEIEKSVEIGFI
jgi:hypothetical protein